MSIRKGFAKGKGKGYKNLMGNDSQIHSQSARGVKQPQRIKAFDRFCEVSKPKAPLLLQKGHGLQRIPMKGLKELEKAGQHFQEATHQIDDNLKEIRDEIKRRSRKKN